MLSQAAIRSASSLSRQTLEMVLLNRDLPAGEVGFTALLDRFPRKWCCSLMGSCPAGLQPSQICLSKCARPNSWVFWSLMQPISCASHNIRPMIPASPTPTWVWVLPPARQPMEEVEQWSRQSFCKVWDGQTDPLQADLHLPLPDPHSKRSEQKSEQYESVTRTHNSHTDVGLFNFCICISMKYESVF